MKLTIYTTSLRHTHHGPPRSAVWRPIQTKIRRMAVLYSHHILETQHLTTPILVRVSPLETASRLTSLHLLEDHDISAMTSDAEDTCLAYGPSEQDSLVVTTMDPIDLFEHEIRVTIPRSQIGSNSSQTSANFQIVQQHVQDVSYLDVCSSFCVCDVL